MSGRKPETFEWRVEKKKKTIGSPDETPERRLRLGVLISGSGSNLQALIDAIEQQRLPEAEIVLVVSNKPDAYGVQRALQHKVPLMYLPWQSQYKGPAGEMIESEVRLTALLKIFQVDLIVLAGWMRILSGPFLTQFPQKVINLHPALLPDSGQGDTYITQDGTEIPVFRGLHAVRQALAAGVHVTGSTVHYVTPEVDAGPVICREEISISSEDTEESLHERLKQVEHHLIVEAIRKIAQDRES